MFNKKPQTSLQELMDKINKQSEKFGANIEQEDAAGGGAEEIGLEQAVNTPEEHEKFEEELILDEKRNSYASAHQKLKSVNLPYLKKDKNLDSEEIIKPSREQYVKVGDSERIREFNAIAESEEENSDEKLTEETKEAVYRRKSFIKELEDKGIKNNRAEALYDLELTKAEYDDAKENLAHKLSAENFYKLKDELEKQCGKSYENWGEEEMNQLNKEAGQYEKIELYKKLVVKEYDALNKAKIEDWPSKEKGRLRKLTEWYLKQNKWARVAASSVILGTLGAATGGASAIFGAIGGRALRGVGSITAGQTVGAGFEKIKTKVLNKKYNKKVENLQLGFSLGNIKEQSKQYEELMKKKMNAETKAKYLKAVVMLGAGGLTAMSIGHLEQAYAGGGGGLINKETAGGSAKTQMSDEEFLKQYPGSRYELEGHFKNDIKLDGHEVDSTEENIKMEMSKEELHTIIPGSKYDPKIELAENEWNKTEDFVSAKKSIADILSVDKDKISLTINNTIKVEGLDGEFEVMEDKNILWKGVDKYTILNTKTGRPEEIFPAEKYPMGTAPVLAEAAGATENISPHSNAVAEIKIEGKINTLSEAVEKALKQEGISNDTKDSFIKHWLDDKAEISVENRDELLNKAIRKFSVANTEMGDGNDIQNLVYEGNNVRLNSDGSFEVIKGEGISEAKMVSEDQLRTNAEAIKTPEYIDAHNDAPVNEELKIQEEVPAENVVEIKVPEEIKITIDENHKWLNNYDSDHDGVLSKDEIKYAAERLDFEIKNAKDVLHSMTIGQVNVPEDSLKENYGTYLNEIKTFEAQRASLAEPLAKIHSGEIMEVRAKDLFKIDGMTPEQMDCYKNVIQQNAERLHDLTNSSSRQINLIKLLDNNKDHGALAGFLKGYYKENLYENIYAHTDGKGNLIINFKPIKESGTYDLFITEKGKIYVDGPARITSPFNNWPSRGNVDLNNNNLRDAMKFINNAGAVNKMPPVALIVEGDSDNITGGDIAVEEVQIRSDKISAEEIGVEVKK